MKACEVAERLPKELRDYANIFVKSGEYNDPFAPPSTIQDVVWLAETQRNKEISAESIQWIVEWLDSREDAEESAKALIEQILLMHPLPSNAEVVAGVSIPEYTILPWFKILYQPWSHRFEDAIEQGWKWLKSN